MALQLNVVAYCGGWDLIYEGARYAESHHATREEALSAGAVLARREGAVLFAPEVQGKCASDALPA